MLAAPGGIVLLDGRRRVIAANAAAAGIFGSTPSALAGRTLASLMVPASRGAANASGATDARPVATVPPRWPQQLGRRADGTTFPLALQVLPFDPSVGEGVPARHVAFVRDLSIESALHRELSRAERRLRTLVELAPIAIWVADSERIVFANQASATLTGQADGGALVGQSVYALLSAGDHAELRRQLAAALAHEGRFGRMPARLVCHGAEPRDVEIALAALPDHGRTTVQMVVSDVSQRNREIRELERSRQRLRQLSANVVEAREEERRRIARELHDELGQALSALKMDIADCAGSGAFAAPPARVAGLLASLDAIVRSVRRIAADLRPLMLDDLGLADAIESLAVDFGRRMGLRVQLRLEPVDTGVDKNVAIALYRMVQEALTNVARHARATAVGIELRRDGDELVLSVRDDGIGLPEPAASRDSQFGLLGMQERADALGGSLQLDGRTGAGSGACVTLRLPVAASTVRVGAAARNGNARAG